MGKIKYAQYGNGIKNRNLSSVKLGKLNLEKARGISLFLSYTQCACMWLFGKLLVFCILLFTTSYDLVNSNGNKF